MLLGLGTAFVYPHSSLPSTTLPTPRWRSAAVGVYRLWRDSGYVAGALLAGVIADAFGMRTAILAVAAITLISGIAVALRMPETAPHAAAASLRSSHRAA